MKRALLLLSLTPLAAFSQTTKPSTPDAIPKGPAVQAAPPAPSVLSLLANLKPRNLGPTTMGGRVADIAVYEKEPRIFYVGAAGGGVWRTDNGGMTFKPVFDKAGSANVGAVAVSQRDANLVWVGTGEGTSRNSAAWGDGIYKSTDGGTTWKNMGLPNSYHFSRIVIDPRDNNTVYAGVLGQLWGQNPDRGVYKTTDGGKSWKRVLYTDDKGGIADLAMDPSNSRVLLAAVWEHMRKPYTFVSGGTKSGLYKSTDGGVTWKQVSKGLPAGPTGRIGISYFRRDPRVVVITVENKSGGVFRSTDGGESWTRLNAHNPRPFYFSLPRQDPNDINRIYAPGVSFQYSDDLGKTFRVGKSSVHVDHHALWIDPSDSNHMLIGEDGGVGQTRDRGQTWEHLNYMPIGQFYAVTYDMRKPYWVYGGLQDNGCWAGPTQTSHGGVAYYDFYGIGGGDGFHVQVDPDDWTTVYSESQGGALQRLDQKYGGNKFIAPRAGKGERFRSNWSTPFIISSHNSKTLYFGGNKVHKSVDRGDTWTAISPDLTENNVEKQKAGLGSVTPEDTGAETHDTIITMSESPLKQGLLWVGTDDGLVQLTQDDGAHWSNLTPNIKDLPANTWVSRVVASRFVEGRAYASFDGHRSNDYKTYVYVTEDFGKTWSKLNGNLPTKQPVYVVKEGLKNPDLLFLGTEFALYVSLDRGQNWTKYQVGDWPTVAVHDLEIQPREEDLLVATHGRSLWSIPIEPLEELTKENLQKDVQFARPSNVYLFGRMNNRAWEGDRTWVSDNTQPGALFTYYLKKDASTDAKITITDPSGKTEIANLTGPAKAGVNVASWSVRGRGRSVSPGDYRVTLKVGDKEYLNTLHIEDVTDQQTVSPPRIGGALSTTTEEQPQVADEDGGNR
jgi:photosystem II stability/assembly factor-like uncharacterized protein